MSNRSGVNPKVLLLVAGIALVVFSAIAIFLAVSYTPQNPTPAPPPTTATSVPPG